MPDQIALVVVPGFMGSRLVRVADGRLVWIDVPWALGHFAEFENDLRLNSVEDPRLVASGVLESLDFGPWVRIGLYRPLRDFALSREGLGLAAPAYHEFAYDWRKSVVPAAQALDALLLGLPPEQRITLVMHSQGGLVAQQLFALGGRGAQRVERMVAVACPFGGLLTTIQVIELGSGLQPYIGLGFDLRDLLRGMPGMYEMMPSRADIGLFFDRQGKPSTPFAALEEMPADRYDPVLLRNAGATVTRTSLRFPVPLRLVAGRGLRTPITAHLRGSALKLDYSHQGDSQCPIASITAATGTARGAEPGTRTLLVEHGEHIELVRDRRFLDCLKADLLG